jgi:hypothetical protein
VLCSCQAAQERRKTARKSTNKEQDMSGVTPAELAGRVGEVIGSSEWMLVDQDMVNKFADATGDHQFIHVNEEMAKMTPFGGTIAHGFLSLSLLPVLMAKSDLPQGRPASRWASTMAATRPASLPPCALASACARISSCSSSMRKRPGQWQQTIEYTLEIEGEDKPACIAEWITQFFV